MIDKISGNLPTGYTRDANPIHEAPETPIKKPSPVHKPSTEVNLSAKAQFLQKALQAARSAPEIRTDVVQAIQNQLKAGTYQVNHQQLADRIVSLWI